MNELWRRLGLQAPKVKKSSIQTRIALTAAGIKEQLQAKGMWRKESSTPRLVLPDSYAEVLEAAASYHREDPERCEELLAYYTTWMPAFRVEQLGSSAEAEQTFFHRPLDWDEMPKLKGAIGRLFELLKQEGIDPQEHLGADSIDDYVANTSTLAQAFERTFFGRSMPMMYAFPTDLSVYLAEVSEGSFSEVFERRLIGPWIHELSHLARNRRALFPPLVDESISGYLGIMAWDGLAFPAADADNAIMGSPWFGQVGQTFFRVFGHSTMLKAHAGVMSWEEALTPSCLAAIERVGWEQLLRGDGPNFLEGNTSPEVWHKLLYLHLAGQSLDEISLESLEKMSFAAIPAVEVSPFDADIVRDALRAMCLRNFTTGYSYRVCQILPTEPIRLDFEQCRVERESHDDSLDPEMPAYVLPPAVAAIWREKGHTSMTLELTDLGVIPDVVKVLMTGSESLTGPGFVLR